jgi:CubicO group peptidase (beta-lactamase class C family)
MSANAIDRLLARAVDDGEVPGVVAIAVDAQGTRYQGAFGVRELGQSAPMTLDTICRIASMTKPITVVAALRLVERGDLGLDEPVGDRLPSLAAVQVLAGFDADGAPRYRRPRRPITLRHLLTHTSGFAYAEWNADLRRLQQQPIDPTPMVNDPGERWEYGTGIDWAGRLVERTTGRTLEDYFRDEIFGPLGMVDTSFLVDDRALTRLAARHQRGANGTLTPFGTAPPGPPAVFSGGGGLFSTGPDYARFLRMLLGGGGLDGACLLAPDTVTRMAENQIGDLQVSVMRSTDLAASRDGDFFPGMSQKWGLAGLINTAAGPNGRAAGSWAWAGFFNTYFWVDGASGVAGLVLTQLLPFCDPAVLRLYGAFERAIYGRRL